LRTRSRTEASALALIGGATAIASAIRAACSRASAPIASASFSSPACPFSPTPRNASSTVALTSRACLRDATMLPLPVTTLPAENTVG
jgi:hypothetical protein